MILAQSAATDAERMALYREGVRRGAMLHKRELAQAADPDISDHYFWGDHATRPYMRAVLGLALLLWRGGAKDDRREAIDLARHLLAINPSDNQGVRFILMNWLPLLGHWRDLERLLRGFGDERRTETLYTRALLAFRNREDGAGDRLDQAFEVNPHVPRLIAGDRPPQPDGDSVEYRGRTEAQNYAHHAHDVWASVPGAREWIGLRADVR